MRRAILILTFALIALPPTASAGLFHRKRHRPRPVVHAAAVIYGVVPMPTSCPGGVCRPR